MTLARVHFSAEAALEVEAARDWYVERSAWAARVFVEEVAAAIHRIEEAPLRWPKAAAGTRRHPLHRFPYLVIYRVKHGDIQVIALAHAKRKPGYWKSRLKF